MRANEDQFVENLPGGRLIKVWKKATGEDDKLKFLWDSWTNMI